MAFNPAAPREAYHTRTISCQGWRRQDGDWDVEGRMVDTKPFARLRRMMWLCITPFG